MGNPLLSHYIRLTEFLGRVLGPDYEVALHDLTNKDHSIIAIANNHISGREVGAPLTNVALKVLKDQSYDRMEYMLHYPGVSASGKALRSSTFFIKDGEELVGMLCVNFDDSRYEAVIQQVLQLCHRDSMVETSFQFDAGQRTHARQDAPSTERFHNSIREVAGDAVARELKRMDLTADQLDADERLGIVAALEPQGIFLLKGAVKEVADALGCSQATIYRYLAQVRKESAGPAGLDD